MKNVYTIFKYKNSRMYETYKTKYNWLQYLSILKENETYPLRNLMQKSPEYYFTDAKNFFLNYHPESGQDEALKTANVK